MFLSLRISSRALNSAPGVVCACVCVCPYTVCVCVHTWCVCVHPYTACVHPSVHSVCVSVHMVCMCVRTPVCLYTACACTQHACVSIHSVCVCGYPFTVCVCPYTCVCSYILCVCPYMVCVCLYEPHTLASQHMPAQHPRRHADVEVEIAEQMLLGVLPGPVLPIPPQARPVMRGLVFVPLNLSPSMAGKCWFSCSIFIGKSPTHPGDGFTKHTQAQNWICLELAPGPLVSARCDSWGPQRGPFVPLQMDGGAWRLGGAARES